MPPTKDNINQPRLKQPKAPSEDRDWEAMDIFVFSNGQQYSPPRKYHLRAEELNWWKATLGYIARSQYGAIHAIDRYSTIELYSIDGNRISSPMELRDGSAYVAVVPPDAFIDAQYEKYIIKATKSWEKRQSKLKSARRDLANSGQSKSKMSIEISEENIQNSTRDGILVSGSSQKRQAQGCCQQGSHNKSANVIFKPKRRPYSGSNRTSILRKLNNELKTPFEAKKTTKRKEEPVIENVKMISPLARNLNDKSEKGRPAVNKIFERPRTPLKKTDSPTLIHHSTSPVYEHNIHDKPLTKKSTNELNFVDKNSMDNVEIGYVLEDQESIVLSKYDKTPTKKIPEITVPVDKKECTDNVEIGYILEDKEIIVISKSDKRTKPVTEVTLPVDNKESSDNVEIEHVLESEEIIVISNPPKKEENDLMYMFWNLNNVIEDNNLPKPLIPNELTIHTAKADTLNIDVAVESITRQFSPIQKPSRNNSKTETDHGTQPEPMTNEEPFIAVANNADAIDLKLNVEFKDGRGIVSSVQAKIIRRPQPVNDVGQDNQNTIYIDNIIKESKSLKSLPDCDCECSKKDNNIYILQCNCDPQKTTDNNGKVYAKIIGHDHEPTTYLIVVPIVTVIEKDGILNQETSKQTTEKEVQNDDEIVTVVNFMDGGQELCYFPSYLPLSIEYKEIPTRGVTNVDCYAMSTGPLTEVENNYEDSEKAGTSSDATDASTQTEWCSIVLEVRRHEDGRYTFHLPPLKLLRSYNKDIF